MAARRYWRTYFVVAVVVLALAFTAILLSPKRYTSTTRLMVSIEGSTTAAAYQNDEVGTRRVLSYMPLITSGVVSRRVVDKLGLPLTPEQLASKINVANVPPRTPLIDIEVTDDSPQRARQIAKTLASEFIKYADSIETPTGEDSQKVHTTIVSDPAEGRENPLTSVLLGVLAAVAALLLGAVAVWIRAARQRDVPADAQAEAPSPREEEAADDLHEAPSDEEAFCQEPVEATQHS
ncbi:YveK family protein [Mycolicibacterium agri]|nr:protein tyrosine kinase [Mycolicibacterium agri]